MKFWSGVIVWGESLPAVEVEMDESNLVHKYLKIRILSYNL